MFTPFFVVIYVGSQISKIANATSVTNNPLYYIQNNMIFIAPTDGYARISAQGVLAVLNSNDGAYAPMCVNRYAPGNQIVQSFYARKGTPIKWLADDASTSIVFWPIVS